LLEDVLLELFLAAIAITLLSGGGPPWRLNAHETVYSRRRRNFALRISLWRKAYSMVYNEIHER
jgi:hypothetical protein